MSEPIKVGDVAKNEPKPFHEWKAEQYAKDQANGTPRMREDYYRLYGGYCNKVRHEQRMTNGE